LSAEEVTTTEMLTLIEMLLEDQSEELSEEELLEEDQLEELSEEL
jgi:hypothetical protein